MTRTERIKSYILSNPPEICLQRCRIYTEECLSDEAVPIVLRRAKAFKRYLEEVSLYIGEDDLLLGNSTSKPLGAALYPEYAVNWILEELDTFETRERQRFVVSEEQKKEIRALCAQWETKTHYDRVDYNLKSTIGEYLMGSGADGTDFQHPSVNQTMSIEHNQNGDGHIIPDYLGLLNTGLEAVIEKTKLQLDLLDVFEEEYLEKKAFLESVILSLEGAIAYGGRLSRLAMEKAKETQDVARKAELLELVRICSKVPAQAPESFHEALQMVLLIHLFVQMESNGHSISLGRMDSYLLPYYQKDCAEGEMDAARAQQLYECFLLKCFEANKLRDWMTTENLGGNQLFQTITLGGQTPSGESAVNDLSYIFLKALGNTNMNIPTVVVSAGKNTPLAFYEAALEALEIGRASCRERV